MWMVPRPAQCGIRIPDGEFQDSSNTADRRHRVTHPSWFQCITFGDARSLLTGRVSAGRVSVRCVCAWTASSTPRRAVECPQSEFRNTGVSCKVDEPNRATPTPTRTVSGCGMAMFKLIPVGSTPTASSTSGLFREHTPLSREQPWLSSDLSMW